MSGAPGPVLVFLHVPVVGYGGAVPFVPCPSALDAWARVFRRVSGLAAEQEGARMQVVLDWSWVKDASTASFCLVG
eukprot:CAMPEP_0204422310 /NCGR_PEP_ID=MMETSP0470-20130426/35399_1 /ASSEMBLY_ACC=CAM_ASM_000385 /TAXON_ID=2969 /ORGANISM="Oxyrrhis marina" /LENGTH=75 /DNA_ID=CAMNT_0051419529 /DNA_START=461 /DNA_END=685 /DNA_ORIENTATION=+